MATKVLVTAGGTKARLDDVRYIGNFSKGRFGLEVAKAFTSFGAEVHLLGSEEMVEREGLRRARLLAEITTFRYFEDFQDSLFEIIEREKPNIVVMAAAVSDWLCAETTVGKIDSKQAELVLRLIPAPKLIASLRERCGKQAFLIGFKLLSGASPQELINKAREQLRGNRLNLVVANDLAEPRRDQHPFTLVTPEGGAISVCGRREETAKTLVDFICRRYHVDWTKSVYGGDCPQTVAVEAAKTEAEKLLRFARSANLFHGTNGNLSWRIPGSDGFLVSPRQVEKIQLTTADLVCVKSEPTASRLFYYGLGKSSIDSAVQAELYRQLPNIRGFLHLHPDAGIVIPDVVSTFPYPCGALQEADEVMAALNRAACGHAPFSVELIHHGYLFGLENTCPERLLEEWRGAENAYRAHLAEIGQPQMASALCLQPIFISARIAGVAAAHLEEKWASCFLLPMWRGGGYGQEVIDVLDRRGETVAAHDLCGVTQYYLARGWRAVGRRGRLTFLAPPSKER